MMNEKEVITKRSFPDIELDAHSLSLPVIEKPGYELFAKSESKNIGERLKMPVPGYSYDQPVHFKASGQVQSVYVGKHHYQVYEVHAAFYKKDYRGEVTEEILVPFTPNDLEKPVPSYYFAEFMRSDFFGKQRRYFMTDSGSFYMAVLKPGVHLSANPYSPLPDVTYTIDAENRRFRRTRPMLTRLTRWLKGR